VQLWTRSSGSSTLIAERATDSTELVLELEAFPDRYELSFRDSRGRCALGHAPTAPLSSESAGGFTGVYIGLFATNSSSARMPPADFDWFEYEPRDE
jgi:alpha-N-arabinofuranosidase